MLRWILGLLFGRRSRGPDDEESFREWEQSPEEPVTKSRSRKVQQLLASVGRDITIIYRGRRRIIRPIRLLKKINYDKTYVIAWSGREQKHFELSKIQIP